MARIKFLLFSFLWTASDCFANIEPRRATSLDLHTVKFDLDGWLTSPVARVLPVKDFVPFLSETVDKIQGSKELAALKEVTVGDEAVRPPVERARDVVSKSWSS